MRNRFLKNIRTAKFVMCASTLFISIGILFGSAPFPRTQTAEAPEKSESGMTVLERKCEIPDENKKQWEEPEEWLWGELCEGRSADFTSFWRVMKLNPGARYKWPVDEYWMENSKSSTPKNCVTKLEAYVAKKCMILTLRHKENNWSSWVSRRLEHHV